MNHPNPFRATSAGHRTALIATRGANQSRPVAVALPVQSAHRKVFLWLTAALAAALLAVASGCGGDNGEPQDANAAASADERSVRVETLVLEPASFEEIIQITGAVEALDDATLSAQAAGTVTYLAPLGSNIGRGATVAQLEPALAGSAVAQAQAQVEAAQASFDLAADNLKRQEPLYRDSVISAIEWENVRAQYNQARAGLSQAEAALSQAQESLRRTRVSTPFSGTVEEHFVELGEQVTPGREIARVINTSRVKVTAGVPERYAAEIGVGTPVLLDFQAYRGRTIRGTVSFVGSAIDRDTRTFPIEILVENSDRQLKPQMIADVSVTIETIEDALVVPRAAVMRTEDGHVVYVVQEDDGKAVAARRDVILGPGHGGDVVVTNLQAGDEVVVLGQNNLTEGDLLQVMDRHTSASAVADSVSTPMPQTD